MLTVDAVFLVPLSLVVGAAFGAALCLIERRPVVASIAAAISGSYVGMVIAMAVLSYRSLTETRGEISAISVGLLELWAVGLAAAVAAWPLNSLLPAQVGRVPRPAIIGALFSAIAALAVIVWQ